MIVIISRCLRGPPLAWCSYPPSPLSSGHSLVKNLQDSPSLWHCDIVHLCRVPEGGRDGAAPALPRGRSSHGRCRFEPVFTILNSFHRPCSSRMPNFSLPSIKLQHFRKRSRPVLSGGILHQVPLIKIIPLLNLSLTCNHFFYIYIYAPPWHQGLLSFLKLNLNICLGFALLCSALLLHELYSHP